MSRAHDHTDDPDAGPDARVFDERRTASVGAASRGTAGAAPANGAVIAGKYRVERLLGRGGMGVVVEATHLVLRERVALKFVEGSAGAEATGRLLREARLMAAVKDERVARVFDVGTEQGVPYVVMERLDGESLADLLLRGGPLPIAEAVAYATEACLGLGAAHAKGVVHRDFKPSNAFVARRADGKSVVKVLDFGIAKELIADPADAGSLTASTAVLGSPCYMAPEQVRSARSVDQRADVWSLGATLYELLAGVPPFRAETTPGVLAAVVADPPAPLRAARPEVPEALERVVLRCLEKDPGERFADMASLVTALDASCRRPIDEARDAAPAGRPRRAGWVAPLGAASVLALAGAAWTATRPPFSGPHEDVGAPFSRPHEDVGAPTAVETRPAPSAARRDQAVVTQALAALAEPAASAVDPTPPPEAAPAASSGAATGAPTGTSLFRRRVPSSPAARASVAPVPTLSSSAPAPPPSSPPDRPSLGAATADRH